MVNKPLADYTVLDLTIARAGPTAVRLLSDWGANVIRVEAPQGAGDFTGGSFIDHFFTDPVHII